MDNEMQTPYTSVHASVVQFQANSYPGFHVLHPATKIILYYVKNNYNINFAITFAPLSFKSVKTFEIFPLKLFNDAKYKEV